MLHVLGFLVAVLTYFVFQLASIYLVFANYMENLILGSSITRRGFVTSSLGVIGFTSLASATSATEIKEPLTVQRVIEIILKEIPGTPVDKTVDTLKAGAPDLVVTGVVTTMFATIEVIRKAIELKANFIIVHEPTFYNHLDETGWLEADVVYSYKKKLLEDNKIAVWRFHDYWHRHNPDGIRMGVLAALGWTAYYDASNPRMITLPPIPLKQLIAHCKNKLEIMNLRFIGDATQVCKRILLMPGASGGKSQIQTLGKEEPDVIICGEVAEWETSEYIRDARAMGAKRSLIVLGHAQSEEPGMRWLVPWLQSKIDSPVTHILSNNPFTWA
jgi:putative NIF3 family GTP cyclohydrolase 1 type 2